MQIIGKWVVTFPLLVLLLVLLLVCGSTSVLLLVYLRSSAFFGGSSVVLLQRWGLSLVKLVAVAGHTGDHTTIRFLGDRCIASDWKSLQRTARDYQPLQSTTRECKRLPATAIQTGIRAGKNIYTIPVRNLEIWILKSNNLKVKGKLSLWRSGEELGFAAHRNRPDLAARQVSGESPNATVLIKCTNTAVFAVYTQDTMMCIPYTMYSGIEPVQ